MAAYSLTRPLLIAVIALVGLWLVVYLRAAMGGWMGSHIGWDFAHYLEATRRWLEVGSPYEPRFFAPYVFDDMAFVHPPVALLLFAPFLVLPAVLWWSPLAIVAWCLWYWRPALWGWTLIALVCALPLTLEKVLLGNSAIWCAAFVALGLHRGWPAIGLVVKPVFLPLAVIGVRRRSFWIAAGLVAFVGILFGPLWAEWLTTLRNFSGGPWYVLLDLPLVLVPVIGYLSR